MPSSRLIAEPLAYPYLTMSNSLRNAVPHGAAPQALASASSAVGSQGDAANAMNCASISGCVGAMVVRIIVPSLRMKNSSGSQNGQFGQLMVTRSR